MNRLKVALRELVSLFIDDGRFAAGIVAWALAIVVAARLFPLEGYWAGIVLFAGLATILAMSAMRRVRR